MFKNEIPIGNEYKIIKFRGSGQFGRVYEAEKISTNEKVAIKEINKTILKRNEYLLQSFFKELEVMKLLSNNENSVKYIGNIETEECYYIIMELCDTDLDIILKEKKDGFTEKELKQILIELNNVFHIIKEKQIIHRDIKLKNILIKYDNKIPLIKFKPKLSDFGFSKVMDEDITSTKLGTPATMAPEVLKNEDYNWKADIYSLGVISYQLLFKRLPFNGRNEKEIIKNIMKSKGIEIPKNCSNKISDDLIDLLNKMLEKDQFKRIDYDEYFSHQFFKIDINEKNDNSNLNLEERFIDKVIIFESFNFTLSKAKDKLTNEFVLIKEFPKNIFEGSINNKQLYDKEIGLLNQLNVNLNNCFIQFIDYFKTDLSYIIVTEYCEGKFLDDLIKEKNGLNEEFIYKILCQLIPCFKIICDKKIVLEFLSCKSFIFKYFKSENDFQIKFFDYGLFKLTSNEIERENYLLSETINFIPNQKTNILNLGIIIYKMTFNEFIYNFNEKETIKQTIENNKTIKIKKKISKSLKYLIERTCHLEIDKRYDYQSLFNDPFINGKNILMDENNKTKKISNNFIENILEYMNNKISTIIKYYDKLIKDTVTIYLKKYSKEISSFLMLCILEVKYIIQFLTKEKVNDIDEELHIIKIMINTPDKIDYYYSDINLTKDSIGINKDDKNFEIYNKKINELETKLKDIFSKFCKKINLDLDTKNNVEKNQNYSFGSIEKYFFKVFEDGLVDYTYNEYNNAEEILIISKYISEYIIFIHLITKNKKPNCHFSKIIEMFDNEKNNENSFCITFIGGVIKEFKKLNIIEENKNISSDNNSFGSFIEFYPENIKLIEECKNKKK